MKFLFLALLGLTSISQASPLLLEIELDTTAFVGNPTGPFTLDIQLNDGGQPNNNSVKLSNFVFGGGSAFGLPSFFGGATGSLASSVEINDSEFFNDFSQSFTPGSALRFRLELTSNQNVGGAPDQFSLAILDGTGAELPTASLPTFGTSVVLLADLSGNSTQLLRFGSAPGAGISFVAPSQTIPSNPVPEPSTLAFTSGALVIMRLLRKRTKTTR